MLERQPVLTISHKCNNCGDCCRGRGDIFLTPLNVFQISQFLGISQQSLINRYCKRIGKLEVCLTSKGAENECIFLKNNGNKTACAIYPIRPMACYLFPLSASSSPNLFTENFSPCPSSTSSISVEKFVYEQSNSRYLKDFKAKNKFVAAISYLENVENLDTEDMFHFLFFNTSEEEIEQKLNSILSSF